MTIKTTITLSLQDLTEAIEAEMLDRFKPFDVDGLSDHGFSGAVYERLTRAKGVITQVRVVDEIPSVQVAEVPSGLSAS